MLPTFREIMVDYIPEWARSGEEANRTIEWCQAVGEWFDSYPYADLVNFYKNCNPELVPIEQIQLLADLIGLKITYTNDDEISLRRQLRRAIDWYRIKGTIKSGKVIIYSLGFNIQIFDLWSSNYFDFIRFPRVWLDKSKISGGSSFNLFMDTGLRFDENINMDTFYKTPHLDIVIAGDRYRTFDSIDYMFRTIDFSSLQFKMDEILPAHAVPRYYLEMMGETDESKNAHTIVENKISTVVTDNWLRTFPLLDDGFNMDEGLVFDQTPIFFLEQIKTFKVGRGNVGVTPTFDMLNIEDLAYGGTIKKKEITAEHVDFEIEIPDTISIEQISEIGLFDETFNNMYVLATCPIINKGAFSLIITIRVHYGIKF